MIAELCHPFCCAVAAIDGDDRESLAIVFSDYARITISSPGRKLACIANRATMSVLPLALSVICALL